jgi:hypothetical protein
VRAYKEEVRQGSLASLDRIAKGIALAGGIPEDRAPILKVSDTEVTPAMFNDPALTGRIATAMKTALGPENVIQLEPVMGSEDFGQLGLEGHQIPTMMFRVGGHRCTADRRQPADRCPPAIIALGPVLASARHHHPHRSPSHDGSSLRVDAEPTARWSARLQVARIFTRGAACLPAAGRAALHLGNNPVPDLCQWPARNWPMLSLRNLASAGFGAAPAVCPHTDGIASK